MSDTQGHHHGHTGGHEFVEEAVFKYVSGPISGESDSSTVAVRSGSGPSSTGSTAATGGSGRRHSGIGVEGLRVKDKDKEMDWYLKHNDEEELHGRGEDSSAAAAAVAAAAVAAALGERGKRRGSDELEALKKSKRQKAKAKKLKSQLGAVDPELASLDSTDNDHLVRKAIMDVDHISQHPDIQQYLNTEDEETEKDKDKDDELGLAPAYEDSEQKIALKKAEVLPKILDPDSSDRDIGNLIREAVKKAAHIINLQTQSTGKSFDETEEEALEQFVQDYQVIKGMTRRQICERIWSNERRKDDFWTNICRVLPYRTRSSIYKHVRRKYHIFEQRGKWTPEEDAELARWCMEKEGQWSNIGKVLGRMPEDCRDRWRNYIKCGASRASNKWSPEEEEKLKSVITEILESAPKNHLDGVDDKDEYEGTDDNRSMGRAVSPSSKSLAHELELVRGDRVSLGDSAGEKDQGSPGLGVKAGSPRDVINWTIVSERMGGQRSRIQCRYKWNKLLKKEAMNKIKTISDEDKTWLLLKLKDLGFTEDSQVDWEELAALMPGRRWTGTELKLCYEKLRTSVRQYKKKPISEICRELVDYHDGKAILSKT
ncbi:ABL092Wp [Eremothecium gossypii ATCC 10895]|uniref:ABL092Wp n=1 Tax=Eremothecium gossypii (strain ATCC 10895 / CBS 109.51 / FGSC 9923 / NRRL Y-1056) TaxID=284811 RepID=Q75DW5_EREGS|nr:ABL092Wp [Eremothecium gossypii ATCC 10895]AAS50679.1 ABL092Wp [Eremothecium gossypii ATCC 10895]AEY94967.1 FABL092Wp [Eremothecium gossypii FDAG1]